MKKIMIKNIEIRYDDNQNHKIDYIKNVISNNYDLFSLILGKLSVISLVPTDDDGVMYISDFDSAFYEVVNKAFNNETTSTLFNNPDLMPALYVEYLVRNAPNKQMSLVQPNPDITDDMLNSLIAYIYFTNTSTFDDFVMYLKEKKDNNKILSWLQTQTRFDAYNYLLEITINYLKQSDFDLLDNISSIINITLNRLMSNILSQENEKEIELPSITIQEFDNLFNEFLKFIGAPESWKQIYKDLKESGKISFENQVDDFDNSKCYRDENDALKILISTDGTVKIFCSFVHEFVHYVSMQGSVTISQLSISELPSIFFEKVAAEFLKSNGYKDNIVDKVVKFRNQNNIEIYMGLSSLFRDILSFIRKGAISKNDKITFWEEQFRIMYETRVKLANLMEENGREVDLKFLERPKIDIPAEVDKECDSLIDAFIQNGLLIVDGYQYLLDTYLAEEILKKSQNDSTVTSRMITITNNLGNMKLQDILTEFDIQDLFNQSKEKRQ